MSRTFSDSIEADVAAIFLNTDEFAVTVKIVRGTSSTDGVVAMVASKTTGTEPQVTDGIGTDFESRNYRIRASEYVIGGVAVVPKNGDTIIETLRSGATIKCEVQPTVNEPCYQSDLHGLIFLVRTKRVV